MKTPRAKSRRPSSRRSRRPDSRADALGILKAKKNLRLLRVAACGGDELVVKSISGGFLAQTADTHRLTASTGAS